MQLNTTTIAQHWVMGLSSMGLLAVGQALDLIELY